MRLFLAVAALALLPCGTAAALAPGDYDRTFGTNGTVVTRIGPLVPAGQSKTAARDVEVLPDGRILVAGSAPDDDGDRAVAIARYGPEGRLDRSFGDGGIVVMQLGATESSASALSLGFNGTFAVTGTATEANGSTGVLVARFGAGGAITSSTVDQVGTGETPASAGLDVAVQPDGKVIVAGRASTGGEFPDPFVARYDGSGRDPGFATGLVVDPPDRSDPGEGCSYGGADASAVVVTPAGTIVTGGTLGRVCGERDERVGLLRAYTPVGSRDPAFATGSTGLGGINALTPGPGDTILAGGVLDGAPGAARYHACDGSLDGPPGDEFFVPNGFGTVAGLGSGAINSLRQQPSARIVAAVDDFAGQDVVVRLGADGARDPGFAIHGVAAAGLAVARAVAVQDDDVIVAGDRASIDGKDAPAFVLTRLHGGVQASRISVRAGSRIEAGAARVKLRCSAGPGCEGIVAGPRLGTTSYAMRGGSRGVAEVPVAKALRRRPKIRVRVTNPPGRAVSRVISLR